jgi:hypothetical protein
MELNAPAETYMHIPALELDELGHDFTHIPANAFERVAKVAARKLFVSYVGGEPIHRSADPTGYLMLDLDWLAGTGGLGTIMPESASVAIDGGNLVCHFKARPSEGDFAPYGQVFQTGEMLFGLARRFSTVEEHVADAPHMSQLEGFDAALWGAVPSWLDPSRAELPALSPVPSPGLAALSPALDSATGIDPPTQLRADASVAEVATRISSLSGLSDRELALVFRVTRETFQRWRTGALDNPTFANRRQLGLLLRLLHDLDLRGANTLQWLRNMTRIDDLTPYELLTRGRLDDVELLAAELGGHSNLSDAIGADGRTVTRVDTLPAFAQPGEQPPAHVKLEDDDDWSEVEAEIVGDDD